MHCRTIQICSQFTLQFMIMHVLLLASRHSSSAVYITLAAGVGLSGLSFVFVPQLLVFVAGAICIAK
jgi:hypothetical protein